MEDSPRDLQRGIGGGDDGEHKARRLDSDSRAGAEVVDLSLGLSLGGRFGAERRSGEGLSATPQPQGSGFPLSAFPGSTAGAEVQPSATPLNSIKEEEGELRASLCPSQGILMSTGSLPAGIEGGSRKRKAENLKRLEAKRRIMAMVREMPLVWTRGLPNGRRVVGLLYNYSKVDEVRILCMCHGSFLSPAEFVEHAGGGQVANPLRSILVKPSWL